MKKITMSLLAVATLATSSLVAEEKAITSFADAITTWTASGEFRTFYIDRTYTGGIENNRNSLATGGISDTIQLLTMV